MNLSVGLTNYYPGYIENLHPWLQTFIEVVLLAILVSLFFIFIWKLYHITSKRNLIKLNLKQYNTAKHPGIKKFFGILIYLLEYLIIFPFFVVVWFFVFTLFVMLLARELSFASVLTVSTVIIIVIRTTSYYKEGLSKDISKLLPFALLAVAITEKEFFNFNSIFERISQLPLFFENILVYMGIIVAVEIILRFFDIIFYLIRKKHPKDNVEEPEEIKELNKILSK